MRAGENMNYNESVSSTSSSENGNSYEGIYNANCGAFESTDMEISQNSPSSNSSRGPLRSEAQETIEYTLRKRSLDDDGDVKDFKRLRVCGAEEVGGTNGCRGGRTGETERLTGKVGDDDATQCGVECNVEYQFFNRVLGSLRLEREKRRAGKE